MKGFIDLHTHSTASDGSMKPAELVKYARTKGLSAIAITDHDTVDGVEEAMEAGGRIGIEVVAGVEIGVEFDPEMHILAYFFGEAYRNIRDVLVSLRKKREERNPKIIAKLNKMGFSISMDDVFKKAGGSVIGRAHIAGALLEKGYVSSIQEAFDKYLSSGRPAYFKKDKLTPAQGIHEILRAGGIPVLAHPIYLGMEHRALDDLLFSLKREGLMGIEVFYSENSPQDTEKFLGLAGKHRLLITGGSDFHGVLKDGIEIGAGRGGLKIPYILLEKLKTAAVSGRIEKD